jgi:hypothetical protein
LAEEGSLEKKHLEYLRSAPAAASVNRVLELADDYIEARWDAALAARKQSAWPYLFSYRHFPVAPKDCWPDGTVFEFLLCDDGFTERSQQVADFFAGVAFQPARHAPVGSEAANVWLAPLLDRGFQYPERDQYSQHLFKRIHAQGLIDLSTLDAQASRLAGLVCEVSANSRQRHHRPPPE